MLKIRAFFPEALGINIYQGLNFTQVCLFVCFDFSNTTEAWPNNVRAEVLAFLSWFQDASAILTKQEERGRNEVEEIMPIFIKQA